MSCALLLNDLMTIDFDYSLSLCSSLARQLYSNPP